MPFPYDFPFDWDPEFTKNLSENINPTDTISKKDFSKYLSETGARETLWETP
jgi:hypothetical protein